MSVLEQYKYEGGIRPDFQVLPTQVTPDEELIIEKAAEAKATAEVAAESVAESAEGKSAEASAATEEPAESATDAGTAEEKSAEAAAEESTDTAVATEEPAESATDTETATEKPAEADAETTTGKPSKKPEDPIRAFLKEKAGANLVEIGRLQKALHSAKKSALIIILHGMPYSGRTETSHYLKKGMKKGVKVYSYKKGCHSHDFLWQMHRRTPKYGNICIMNNSVYADVPNEEGGAEKVRAFEKYLRESGVAVVRIFLNVSPKQQKNRMLEVITTKPGGAPREVPQEKGWRKAFLEQFADVVEAATPETPWYILPADNKWYARCLVTEIVRDALRECVKVQEPEAEPAPTEEKAEAAPAEESVTEPVSEVKAEPAAEVKAEPAAEAKAEPVAEAKTEPVAEAKAEPASATEEPAEPVKKPARRTRRKKTETPTEGAKTEVKAETKADTKSADAAPAKKTTTRRPRRQGPPKTVEETLARRRKRMEDSEG